MKASDLSIGDFVFVKSKNKIGVVHEIDSRSAHVWCGEVYRSVYVNRYAYDDIEPVPLTPEILEKNEFKIEVRGDLLYEYNIDGSLDICISIWGKKDEYGHCKVRQVCLDGGVLYIHELQHALRLCGLDELADNFQI